MSTIPETIYLLKQYNKWRRGDDTITMPEPFELGVAIGDAVRLLREHVTLKSKFEKLTLLAAQTADRNVEFRFRAEKAEAELANEREKAERYRLASLKFEAKLAVAIARAEHALDLWREFIRLLDIREESDSGREFSPNQLVSCRVMDGERINKIITTAKSLLGTQSQPKVVELERDKVRLDWLLARNVTISYQGANGSWVATYHDRSAIDTAMKEVTK